MQRWFNIHKSVTIIHHINRIKDKILAIISTDAEKTFDKIQHLLMINALKKLGIEGMYITIIKVIYDKTYTNLGKTETISSKFGNEKSMFYSLHSFSL
jgi:hypothetical protein